MTTICLQNGQLVDGAGRAAFKGHLLINGNRIEAVIPEGQELPPSDKVIDADGCVIAPGFIDMHSHTDWTLPHVEHPGALKCLLEQGVTTVVGGNCGFSPAPIRPETIDFIKHHCAMLTDKPLDFTWCSMSEFLDHVDKTGPVLNMALQVGHASVRLKVSDSIRGAMAAHDQESCLNLMKGLAD